MSLAAVEEEEEVRAWPAAAVWVPVYRSTNTEALEEMVLWGIELTSAYSRDSLYMTPDNLGVTLFLFWKSSNSSTI